MKNVDPKSRSVQQLAEVLASLSASSSAQIARQRGIAQIAEGFDCEIAVLISQGAAVASVGYPSDRPITAEILEVAAKGGGEIDVAGVGLCSAVAVPVPITLDCRVLLARSGTEGFTREEVSLLGSLGRILATVLDTMQLRDTVRRNEQQLADAQRVARLGSFEWDLVALRGSWSDGLYRILGIDQDRPRPDLGVFLGFIHPEDRRGVQHRVQLALAGDRVDDMEYRIVRPDGDIVWVRARSEVVRDAQGQPVLFRGTLLDVDKARAVDETLRATTARLELLGAMATAANEASELVAVLDFAVNKLCEHTGWTAGRAFMPGEFASRGPLVAEVCATKAPAWSPNSFAFPVLIGTEVTCVLELTADQSVTPDDALYETIDHVATQLSRVAERERSNRELAAARDAAMESSRMKSEFLATMSHEIRTPMNAVIGLTGLLLNTDLDDRQMQYAEGVESAGEALLAIINDILDFSKIEAGKLELDECDFDLVQVIEEAVSLVALTAHRKGLDLVCHPALELPTDVRGDPAHLRQVLLNLTANAAKFTSEGEVVVRASLDAELDSSVVVRFDVYDTGIGIAEDVRSRLFEPFSQADASTTRKYGGTGLGLAICRRLVDAMGGEIGVDSELGKGSDFWFTVPLRRQSRRQGALPVPSHAHVRVLVADGNAAVRSALCDRLTSWGAICNQAPDGPTALEILHAAAARHEAFDFLLADEGFVNREGAPVVSAVDADSALRGLRVITLTRDTMGNRVITPISDCVATALTKPVRVSQLREVMTSPALTRPARPRNSRPLANRTESRGHVLVVEDNATNQLVAVGILRFLGYRADVAANGFEALEAMERTVYDAVLMDCQMPEMDGYTTTGLIRNNETASGRHTPVIAMTAGATEVDRGRCLAAGMDDYLAKPVKTEHIDAALRRWAVPPQIVAAAR
ncbi:MAG TPA: response regulator [Acidimicrobiales bacterium]|nr:response regulator [Acidimicrobiales bacterium]